MNNFLFESKFKTLCENLEVDNINPNVIKKRKQISKSEVVFDPHGVCIYFAIRENTVKTGKRCLIIPYSTIPNPDAPNGLPVINEIGDDGLPIYPNQAAIVVTNTKKPKTDAKNYITFISESSGNKYYWEQPSGVTVQSSDGTKEPTVPSSPAPDGEKQTGQGATDDAGIQDNHDAPVSVESYNCDNSIIVETFSDIPDTTIRNESYKKLYELFGNSFNIKTTNTYLRKYISANGVVTDRYLCGGNNYDFLKPVIKGDEKGGKNAKRVAEMSKNPNDKISKAKPAIPENVKLIISVYDKGSRSKNGSKISITCKDYNISDSELQQYNISKAENIIKRINNVYYELANNEQKSLQNFSENLLKKLSDKGKITLAKALTHKRSPFPSILTAQQDVVVFQNESDKKFYIKQLKITGSEKLEIDSLSQDLIDTKAKNLGNQSQAEFFFINYVTLLSISNNEGENYVNAVKANLQHDADTTSSTDKDDAQTEANIRNNIIDKLAKDVNSSDIITNPTLNFTFSQSRQGKVAFNKLNFGDVSEKIKSITMSMSEYGLHDDIYGGFGKNEFDQIAVVTPNLGDEKINDAFTQVIFYEYNGEMHFKPGFSGDQNENRNLNFFKQNIHDLAKNFFSFQHGFIPFYCNAMGKSGPKNWKAADIRRDIEGFKVDIKERYKNLIKSIFPEKISKKQINSIQNTIQDNKNKIFNTYQTQFNQAFCKEIDKFIVNNNTFSKKDTELYFTKETAQNIDEKIKSLFSLVGAPTKTERNFHDVFIETLKNFSDEQFNLFCKKYLTGIMKNVTALIEFGNSTDKNQQYIVLNRLLELAQTEIIASGKKQDSRLFNPAATMSKNSTNEDEDEDGDNENSDEEIELQNDSYTLPRNGSNFLMEEIYRILSTE